LKKIRNDARRVSAKRLISAIPFLCVVFKIQLGVFGRLPHIRESGEANTGFEFMLLCDLAKKRLVAHVTLVKKEPPHPALGGGLALDCLARSPSLRGRAGSPPPRYRRSLRLLLPGSP
jgi:hypothetical protein